MEQEKFEQWAVVELFGRSQVAGLVSEQTIGGETFIRVDVPDESGEGWAFTKAYGKGAIYAMTFCTEEVARIAAGRLDVRPVTVWTVPTRTALLEPIGDESPTWEDEWEDE